MTTIRKHSICFCDCFVAQVRHYRISHNQVLSKDKQGRRERESYVKLHDHPCLIVALLCVETVGSAHCSGPYNLLVSFPGSFPLPHMGGKSLGARLTAYWLANLLIALPFSLSLSMREGGAQPTL